MTHSEEVVLGIFRSYRVAPYEMLFLNANLVAQHRSSLSQLIKQGYVNREKRPHAFHLTSAGHRAMQNIRQLP